MKESYPNTHVFGLFLVIVLTGGEIPSIADLRRIEPDENAQQQDNEQFNGDEEVNSQEIENDDDDMVSYDLDISAASNALESYSSSNVSWFSYIFS